MPLDLTNLCCTMARLLGVAVTDCSTTFAVKAIVIAGADSLGLLNDSGDRTRSYTSIRP